MLAMGDRSGVNASPAVLRSPGLHTQLGRAFTRSSGQRGLLPRCPVHVQIVWQTFAKSERLETGTREDAGLALCQQPLDDLHRDGSPKESYT